MYLQKFWVNTSERNKTYQWDFRGEDGRLPRWGFLHEPDPDKRLLFFKLLSICLGASAYTSTLSDQMAAEKWKPFRPEAFGACVISEPGHAGIKEKRRVVELTFTVSKKGRIVQTNQGASPWTGAYKKFSGFSDAERMFGDLVYGVHSHLSEFTPEEVDLNFIPRLRSSRFGTFFEPRFPLTEPNAWLWKQRQRSRYGGARGTIILNTALTAIANLLPGLDFSHWDSDKKAHFNNGPETITLDELPGEDRVMTGWVIDFIRQLGDSRRLLMNLV
ncbi:MAG: hypothetical protein GY859_05210, partial [Desulfobacterales bacterium]|nr:hypothetical protein [Desulfobacterales bacterium]